jgi:hypothetical protein
MVKVVYVIVLVVIGEDTSRMTLHTHGRRALDHIGVTNRECAVANVAFNSKRVAIYELMPLLWGLPPFCPTYARMAPCGSIEIACSVKLTRTRDR